MGVKPSPYGKHWQMHCAMEGSSSVRTASGDIKAAWLLRRSDRVSSTGEQKNQDRYRKDVVLPSKLSPPVFYFSMTKFALLSYPVNHCTTYVQYYNCTLAALQLEQINRPTTRSPNACRAIRLCAVRCRSSIAAGRTDLKEVKYDRRKTSAMFLVPGTTAPQRTLADEIVASEDRDWQPTCRYPMLKAERCNRSFAEQAWYLAVGCARTSSRAHIN